MQDKDWNNHWAQFDQRVFQNPGAALQVHKDLFRQNNITFDHGMIEKIHYIAFRHFQHHNNNKDTYKHIFRQYCEATSEETDAEYQKLQTIPQDNRPPPPHSNTWSSNQPRGWQQPPIDWQWPLYWQHYNNFIRSHANDLNDPTKRNAVITQAHIYALKQFSTAPLETSYLQNLIALSERVPLADRQKEFQNLYENFEYYQQQLKQPAPSAPPVEVEGGFDSTITSSKVVSSLLLPTCFKAYKKLCEEKNIDYVEDKENTLCKIWPEGKNKGTPIEISQHQMSLNMPADQRFVANDPNTLSEQAQKSLALMADAMIAATNAYIETNEATLTEDQETRLKTMWAEGDDASVNFLREYYLNKGFHFGNKPTHKDNLEENTDNSLRITPSTM